MCKQLLVLLPVVILGGCWVLPSPSYVTSQGVGILDKDKIVDQDPIEQSINVILQSLNASPEHIKDINIQVLDVVICVEGNGTMAVADGHVRNSVFGPLVLVSTIQGCFHSIAHELGHIIQARKDGVIDKEHNDKTFWSAVAAAEKWIQETYCADTYKPMTPEEAIKLCE